MAVQAKGGRRAPTYSTEKNGLRGLSISLNHPLHRGDWLAHRDLAALCIAGYGGPVAAPKATEPWLRNNPSRYAELT